MKKASGILLYRFKGEELQVLLVRPCGKSGKKWSIPKGIINKQESAIDAAIRETKEECGIVLSKDNLFSLGSSIYKNKKKEVVIFATEWDGQKPSVSSNEIDKVQFFDINSSFENLHEGQIIFLERLSKHLEN